MAITRDKFERWWQRAIVATFALAAVSFVLMLVTGHDQGVHDNGFGFTLFMILFLGLPLSLSLLVAYIIYAIALARRNKQRRES